MYCIPAGTVLRNFQWNLRILGDDTNYYYRITLTPFDFGVPGESWTKTSASEFKNVRLFYPIRFKWLSFLCDSGLCLWFSKMNVYIFPLTQYSTRSM